MPPFLVLPLPLLVSLPQHPRHDYGHHWVQVRGRRRGQVAPRLGPREDIEDIAFNYKAMIKYGK